MAATLSRCPTPAWDSLETTSTFKQLTLDSCLQDMDQGQTLGTGGSQGLATNGGKC